MGKHYACPLGKTQPGAVVGKLLKGWVLRLKGRRPLGTERPPGGRKREIDTEENATLSSALGHFLEGTPGECAANI
jgi:hypothetical protein